MFNIVAYLALVSSILTATFLLIQAYILLTTEEEVRKNSVRTEMWLSYAVSMSFLSLFILLGNAGWVVSLMAKSSPFSIDFYRELSPYMVILSCAIAATALRFKRRLAVTGLYTAVMILFILLYGIWRAKNFDFYYIDTLVWQIALGYTLNDSIQTASIFVAAVVLLTLVLAFKIQDKIRESIENTNLRNQTAKLAVALVLTAAFSVPMLDIMNPGSIPCDPPNALLWGGANLIAVTSDGKHVYYSQSHGSDERVNSGHTPAFRLYCASLDHKEQVEIPQPIAMTGGFPSPTGKFLLAEDEDLIIMNSSTYKIVKRIGGLELSCYGWVGNDNEIWYGDDSSESVKIYDIKSGVIKNTDISQPLGMSWSEDKRYALWLENFEYNDPNSISIYDYKNNESTEVVTAKNNQDIILCATLSGDNKTVYYVVKTGLNANSRLYLKAADIKNCDDRTITPLKYLTHVFRIKLTRDGRRLLVDGYKDKDEASDSLYNEHFVYLVDLSSGKTRKMLHNKKYGFSWDYSPVNNKLIWNDDYRPEFQEKSID